MTDQQPENRSCNKSLTALQSPIRHQQYQVGAAATDWPAYDKPPHYYASQNSSNVKMISSQQQQQQLHHHQSHATANQQEIPQRQQQQQQQQQQQNTLLASIQRKLFNLLYIYAILIVSLYLTYAAYYFIQQHNYQQKTMTNGNKRQIATAQELRNDLANVLATTDSSGAPTTTAHHLDNQISAPDHPIGTAESSATSKLETKLHLLERYMELIAIDLQETKEKLKEREKCDCSMSCHFNGTRYEDRSSWQNQCDICTCQMGKISCQPRKCPQLKCNDYVTLPGQCCPTCMRQCRYNGMLIRHGEKFNPSIKTSKVPVASVAAAATVAAATTTDQSRNHQTKMCQCHDGLIKCEQISTTTTRPPSKSLKKATTTATNISNGLHQSRLPFPNQAVNDNNNNPSLRQQQATVAANSPDRLKKVPSTIGSTDRQTEVIK